MTASSIIIAAREAGKSSQRALSRASGVPQPTISLAERGEQDVTVKTLDRLLQHLGYQLVAIPSQVITASGAATLVKGHLVGGKVGRANYDVLQLADDLAAAEPVLRAALVVTPAPLTGDAHYDAWIAGVVEYRLAQVDIPAPAWVDEPARFLSDDWLAGGAPGDPDEVRARTSAPFARRGVLIDEVDLLSV